MGVSRFIPAAIPLSLGDIASLVGGKITRGDKGFLAKSVSPSKAADDGAVCFADSQKAAKSIADKSGIICLTSPENAASVAFSPALVIVDRPKHAFGLVVQAMYPNEPHGAIDAGAAVAPGAELGDDVWVKSGAYIAGDCIIGSGTVIEANAVVMHATIGKDCVIGANSVIGGTGFGVGSDDGHKVMLRHLGGVIIGDGCHIGGGVCIDRGFLDDTVIGDYTMIDNLVHISHNVRMGSGNVLCGQTGIGGSATLGDDNIFGAQSGVADHVDIGSGNVFAARSGVTKAVGDADFMAGFPAVGMQDFRRQVATLRRLSNRRAK